ncbi:hypothetical protein ACNJYD_20550 [Bradyrhizobium sp. DASA03005]|uniref:hypothetical protein n=1 Tax=Bradyrhizobium sp. SPXBL-02 TaxID=3395912 RepID=UPI003F6F3C6F
MIRKSILVMIACAAVSTTALAQGGGGGGGAGGASGASAGSAASSGAGTGTSSSSANSGPSAPSGMGTQGTTTGANVKTNNSPNNPNVQPPTANGKSPAAAQAERNSGVGHAPNGMPIGSPGSGTSNEDQK